MKAYGIDKQDDNCCPGHAKYGRKGLSAKGKPMPRKKSKDQPRKKKARQANKKIED